MIERYRELKVLSAPDPLTGTDGSPDTLSRLEVLSNRRRSCLQNASSESRQRT